jgi:hypothetical protein
MRLVAAVPPEVAQRTAINRLMLVTNPQSEQARCCNAVILYAYMIEERDGPSFTAWLYPDAEAALDNMREMWGEWTPIAPTAQCRYSRKSKRRQNKRRHSLSTKERR